MADAQYPITLAEFRAWLETKRPGEIVGVRRSSVRNPIARYLLYRGDARPSVGKTHIGLLGKVYLTPTWATRYLYDVDGSSVRFESVTARTALRLLDRVAHASLPAEDDWERTALESEAVL